MGEIVFAVVITTLVLSGWYGWGSYKWHYRHNALRRNRPPSTEGVYLQHFRDLGLSERVAEGTWTWLQSQTGRREFPILPDDNLEYVFGESIYDLVPDVMSESGCADPSWDTIKKAAREVDTVEDLVRFCSEHCQPREPQRTRRRRPFRRSGE